MFSICLWAALANRVAWTINSFWGMIDFYEWLTYHRSVCLTGVSECFRHFVSRHLVWRRDVVRDRNKTWRHDLTSVARVWPLCWRSRACPQYPALPCRAAVFVTSLRLRVRSDINRGIGITRHIALDWPLTTGRSWTLPYWSQWTRCPDCR